MWVHQKYGMIQIVWSFYSVKAKKWTNIAITDDGRFNKKKHWNLLPVMHKQ